MPILQRELKRNFKPFLVWSIIVIFLNIVTMSAFNTFASSEEQIKQLLEMFPKELIIAFGMDKLDMSSLLGYYCVKSYLFLTLFGSIYVVILAASILSKEESEKTIEFLLAKPVTRNYVVSCKVIAVFIYAIAFNALYTLVNFILFETITEKAYDMKLFILISLAPLLLHLTLGAIGLVISTFIVKAKAVYPIAIGIVMGSYFVSILSSLTENTKNLKYVTPFSYVDGANILAEGRIETLYLGIMSIIIIGCVVATYFIYNKKDIAV